MFFHPFLSVYISLKLTGTVINLTFHSYKYVEHHPKIRHTQPLYIYRLTFGSGVHGLYSVQLVKD